MIGAGGGGDLDLQVVFGDGVGELGCAPADRQVLEGLVEFALHAIFDRLQHIVHGHLGRVCRPRTFAEHSGAHQDGMPVGAGASLLVKLVRTPDVRLWGIADKVHRLRGSVDAVGVFPPLLEKTGSELERTDLRFAERDRLQLLARDRLEHGLQRRTKGSHADAGVGVRGCPHNVVMRKVNWRSFIERLRPGSQPTVLAHAKVQDNLRISCPISAVGKHKDRLDLNLAIIPTLGVLEFFIGEFAERCCVLVVLDNVSGSDDVLEAVALGHGSTLLAFTTDNQDGFVLLGHLPHGSVSTDELARGNFHLKLIGELDASLFLRLTTSICDKDVGTVNSCKQWIF